MQTLICKKPIFGFRPDLFPPNSFFSRTHKNHNFLQIQPTKFQYRFKLCSGQSLGYGGWDNFQLIDESVHSGESNQIHNFLNSLGIGDKKYVFLYLFGFVCALAISRVKVSSIIVFPAGAVVFALGFSVGLVKGGHLKELRLNGNRKKIIDDNIGAFVEKLRNLGNDLQGCNEKVLNIKNDIKGSIASNHVAVSDLEGYVDAMESVDTYFRNAIDIVENCIQSILGGNQEKEGGSDRESGRKRKKSRENGSNISSYFGGLFGVKFGDPKPGKMEGSGKMEPMDVEVNTQKRANMLAAPVKARNLNSALYGNLGNRAGGFVHGAEMGNIGVENEKRNVLETNDDTADEIFDQRTYSYQNKTSRVVNNRKVWLKDYEDEVETMSSQNESYDSVDVRIRMNRMKTGASFGHKQRRRYSFADQESAHENVFDSSPSLTLDNDLEFNRYLAEASNLLKEAKGCLIQKDDNSRADHALHKSAILLSKAVDMRPMSLLAVGQLGNTYLLHGELKLKTSREMRTLLLDDKIANKDKITSTLVNVCEECEELLIKAGRKYKLALSIDGNDMRALYNWGLALSFRAQLIADIGPSAAHDADKVFLAAIDKFDAMMSKSNTYTPDALFRWGAALQQRSRLRPSRSREKVKLLQQARRLYEDALDMDSGNLQLQEALSSCISELEYWYS